MLDMDIQSPFSVCTVPHRGTHKCDDEFVLCLFNNLIAIGALFGRICRMTRVIKWIHLLHRVNQFGIQMELKLNVTSLSHILFKYACNQSCQTKRSAYTPQMSFRASLLSATSMLSDKAFFLLSRLELRVGRVRAANLLMYSDSVQKCRSVCFTVPV